MKTRIVHVIIGLLMITSLKGQIKIGDNPQTLDPASVLELESTSRVLVITRVTDAQMNTINPLRGALVYNIDQQCVHYYNGTEWINICEALDNSFTVTTEAVFNQFSRDSTVVVTQTDDNYNFEVNLITGDNIVPTSINGDVHIQPSSITGGLVQDATLTFDKLADGENTGEVLQWNGNEWILVDETGLVVTEVDGEIGNEVLDATAGGSLIRSGIGTEIDPYTLDVEDAGIGNAELAPDAVTSDKIQDGDVNTDDVANLAITNVKLDKANIPLSGFGPAATNIDLGNNVISNVLDPVLAQDAATKNYVDTEILASNQTIVSADAGNLIVASGTDGGAFYDGDFNNLINVPVGLADGDDDTTYSAGTGIDLTGTTFSIDNANIAPDWANITSIPADIADGDDNTTYSAGTGLNLVGTTFSVDNAGISADWANITSIPADIADGDDDTTYSAGTGIDLTGTTFSIDNANIAPDWTNITSIPADIADGDDDTTYSAGTGIDLTGTTFSIDNTNIAPDWTNITSIPADIADGDDNTTYLAGTGIDLTGTTFSIDNANIAPDWTNITSIPADIADGDDDTTYSAGTGIDLTGTTFSIDNANIAPDWTNITSIPADIADGDDDTTYSAGTGIDLTGTTFSIDNANIAPDWTNITSIPADIADGDDNTTYTAGAGLTLTTTTFSVDNLAGDVTGPTSATVIANDAVTLPKIANGTAAGQLMQWNGTDWVLAQQIVLKQQIASGSGTAGAYTINDPLITATSIIQLTVEENTPGNPIMIQLTGQGAGTFSVQVYEFIAGTPTATNANWQYLVVAP